MPVTKAMPKLIWDERYWAERAEEARAVCDSIQNPECSRIMGEIALSYDRLARLSKDFNSATLTPPKPEVVAKH